MERQMMATAVTLSQIQQQLATVADNIANVGTTGYMSRNAQFSDLLDQQINNIDRNGDTVDSGARLTPAGIRSGSGTRIGDTQLDLSEGSIQATNNPLDVALSSDHQMFLIGVNGGVAYTRAGAFNAQADPQNPNVLNLVTKSGDPVLDQNSRPIRLPAGYNDLQISGNGTITAIMRNGNRVNAGRLGRVTILRPQLLESQGNGLYTLQNLGRLGIGLNQVVQPVGAGNNSVNQGKLENANVDLTKEMSELINLQRNYQLNARSLTMRDQMSGLVNSILH
ncbi:flagellar hook-basal body protein [Sporolactobacillus vineae]|uniref:flagellar hook-basal body protein n=1 Tax=Sporolactobacillus vineae TaxID=444463 RepID=UPI00028920D6|nr:flagellar hook-basal body complex protein [Sporolactobacillus vineae]